MRPTPASTGRRTTELVRVRSLRPEPLAELAVSPAATVLGAVNLLDAVKAAERRGEIDAELQAMDFSDCPTNWARRLDLKAERARLAA